MRNYWRNIVAAGIVVVVAALVEKEVFVLIG
jgi:hypothetical protein